MWACFLYYQELYESDLITILVTTNTATFQREHKLEKAIYIFYQKIPRDVIIANILLVLFRLGQQYYCPWNYVSHLDTGESNL